MHGRVVVPGLLGLRPGTNVADGSPRRAANQESVNASGRSLELRLDPTIERETSMQLFYWTLTTTPPPAATTAAATPASVSTIPSER
ncbi:MAG: hypothetical protein ACHQ50_17105 [Fimbriimonadales bacterium]